MERQQTLACVHRWVLGEPQLKGTEGSCRRCGVQRLFPSGLEMPEFVTIHDEFAGESVPPQAMVPRGMDNVVLI